MFHALMFYDSGVKVKADNRVMYRVIFVIDLG